MEQSTAFVLEKGEAKKQLFEMTLEERAEVSSRVYKRVIDLARAVGQEPVVVRGGSFRKKSHSLR